MRLLKLNKIILKKVYLVHVINRNSFVSPKDVYFSPPPRLSYLFPAGTPELNKVNLALLIRVSSSPQRRRDPNTREATLNEEPRRQFHASPLRLPDSEARYV